MPTPLGRPSPSCPRWGGIERLDLLRRAPPSLPSRLAKAVALASRVTYGMPAQSPSRRVETGNGLGVVPSRTGHVHRELQVGLLDVVQASPTRTSNTLSEPASWTLPLASRSALVTSAKTMMMAISTSTGPTDEAGDGKALPPHAAALYAARPMMPKITLKNTPPISPSTNEAMASHCLACGGGVALAPPGSFRRRPEVVVAGPVHHSPLSAAVTCLNWPTGAGAWRSCT